MILQTALAIVDRDGVDRLSMRRLSDALGRDPVTLQISAAVHDAHARFT